MNLPHMLERPGGWRGVGTACVVAIVLFPSLWLLFDFASSGNDVRRGEIFGRPFQWAMGRSLVQLFWVTFWAFVLGWPYGVFFGLKRCLWRGLAMTLFAVPLFMPTFLWAIGISALRPHFSYRIGNWFDGLSGFVLSSSLQVVPLVVLATALAARYVSAGQLDSARLAGGDARLLALTARRTFLTSLSAALLAALYTISDPGPAQIMGYHGVASEVLIAIAGRHDLPLAIVKALGFAALLLPVTLPIACLCARRMHAELSGRERAAPSRDHAVPTSSIAAAGLLAFPLILISIPVVGLALSLGNGVTAKAINFARDVALESGGATLLYGIFAGLVGLTPGLALALLAGRRAIARPVALLFAFTFFSVAPAVNALGIVVMGTHAPAWLDAFTRGDGMVVVGLGLRFAPLSTLLGVWAFAKIPPSINDSAALHGVPPAVFLTRILFPLLRPTILLSILAIGLLAVGDVATMLLLQVPGTTTYAGRIFAVMDNTSAATVASLCLVYLLGGGTIVAVALRVGARLQRPLLSHA